MSSFFVHRQLYMAVLQEEKAAQHRISTIFAALHAYLPNGRSGTLYMFRPKALDKEVAVDEGATVHEHGGRSPWGAHPGLILQHCAADRVRNLKSAGPL
eukprot:s1568_g7.t1